MGESTSDSFTGESEHGYQEDNWNQKPQDGDPQTPHAADAQDSRSQSRSYIESYACDAQAPHQNLDGRDHGERRSIVRDAIGI
jgi:hypothetical protein